jgi:hypothetical protein
MALIGRAVEFGEIAALLDAAAVGSGGVLTFAGPRGSGKTALLAVAAGIARDRGFEVAGAAPVRGQPGLLLWAQLLQDIGAGEEASRALLDATDSLAVSAALRPLTGLAGGARRLIVIDDIDADGDDAVEALRLVASRLVAGSTVVLVTASSPLGIGRDRVLARLAEGDMAALLRGLPPERLRAVWTASGGRPGTARALAGQLDSLPPGGDPLVHLALHAVSRGEFLAVDDGLIRLLEQAAQQAGDDATRARLLARMSRELLGDPLAGSRRRFLADQALAAARAAGDDAALAEVLDARLYVLWDPAGAADRLATAGDLVKLGQSAGTGRWERDGLFWRFIALMELGQVDEAEITLAAFERAASAAGDAEDAVMALSRHAMLAVLRGRFDAGIELTEEFTARARRIGLADTQRLTASLGGAVLSDRGTEREQNAAVDQLYQVSRRFPGHFYEATAARILAGLGRRVVGPDPARVGTPVPQGVSERHIPPARR